MIPTRIQILSWHGVFLSLNIKHKVIGETRNVSPDYTNYIGGVQGHVPRENFSKLDSRKSHILHSLDRTQLIHTCILLSFSQSLVIHDSRAEVQRFMIPKFLKQRFMIVKCFVRPGSDAVLFMSRT